MGKARCSTFSSRLNGFTNGNVGPDVNLEYIQSLQQLCTQSNSSTTLADLDLVSPTTFDNQYYVNLLSGEGLLASDLALVSGDDRVRQIVQTFVEEPMAFFEEFKKSMVRMGGLVPTISGENGEVRRNCRIPN